MDLGAGRLETDRRGTEDLTFDHPGLGVGRRIHVGGYGRVTRVAGSAVGSLSVGFQKRFS